MPIELSTNHINMNVLDETKTSLRWVHDSIIAEWNDNITSLRSLDSESKKQEIVQKAYAVLTAHAKKTDGEIMQVCAWWASCLLFALQIILVEAKMLTGRKCVDGIYGEQTKQAIIAYKKNVLWYSRANGSIHGRFLQEILAKKSPLQPNPVTPPPVPKWPLWPTPVMPGPYNPNPPESNPFDPLNPFPWLPPKNKETSPTIPAQWLDNFLQTLDEKYRLQAEIFINDISQQYAKSCDPSVANPFSVATLPNKNPVIRLTISPWKTIDLKYPLTWMKTIWEARSLFERLCTHLNTQKNTVFYK